MHMPTPNRQFAKRAVLICVLTLMGLAVAEGILLFAGDRVESIRFGNRYVMFAPVYNRSGSWFHGRLQIGYRPEILLAEHVLTLGLLWFLSRFMAWMNLALGIRTFLTCGVDFGIAATFVRFITVACGRYTLDYVYLSWFHSTYDLVDFYIGILILCIVLWCIPCEVRWLRLKKKAAAGMNLRQRMKWELIFTGRALKAPFIPEKHWKGLLETYGYYLETDREKSA